MLVRGRCSCLLTSKGWLRAGGARTRGCGGSRGNPQVQGAAYHPSSTCIGFSIVTSLAIPLDQTGETPHTASYCLFTPVHIWLQSKTFVATDRAWLKELTADNMLRQKDKSPRVILSRKQQVAWRWSQEAQNNLP